MNDTYLKLYYEWAEIGQLPTNGLCSLFGKSNQFFELLTPVPAQLLVDDEWSWYWGYNGEPIKWESTTKRCYEFTPLRKNIVLFMAAMNGEL